MASRWDHVAMVLCLNGEIHLLEAVMEKGYFYVHNQMHLLF